VLVYLGCELGDDENHARRLAGRVAKLRLFADAAGKTNLAVAEVGGAVLLISQFTLAADTQAGNRPSFSSALPPEPARALVDLFGRCLEEAGLPVQYGRFGAEMTVTSRNEGPATYLLEEPRRT
jgi:D-tyrosyl-tRNA(Tyr) deacylase